MFVDYQNVYHSAREAFGDPRSDPPTLGHVQPAARVGSHRAADALGHRPGEGHRRAPGPRPGSRRGPGRVRRRGRRVRGHRSHPRHRRGHPRREVGGERRLASGRSSGSPAALHPQADLEPLLGPATSTWSGTTPTTWRIPTPHRLLEATPNTLPSYEPTTEVAGQPWPTTGVTIGMVWPAGAATRAGRDSQGCGGNWQRPLS